MGIYSMHLVRELSRREDMDIHVFTPARGRDYDREKVLEYFGNRIKLHNISIASDDFIYNFAFQWSVFRQLPEYHRLYRYDLIHAANSVNMPDIYLKFKPLSIPSIATVHTTIEGQVKGFLDVNKNFFSLATSEKLSLVAYPYIRFMEGVYLRRTRHLLTVSRRFAGMLRDEYHCKADIEPIHNGIDMEVFDYDRTGDPYNRFPQLRGKGPVVLYVGRLVARKGLNLFVEAMARLKDANAHFVFAGRGSEKLLFDLLKRNGIGEDRYTYLGFVPNDRLPWLYKVSSAFVLPSYYENLPISLLEAMAMKVACISSNVGAVDEIIEHGKSGLLFESGDVDKLVHYIRALLDNSVQRERLAEAGCQRVRSEFTSAVMAEKHYRFYNKVLSEAR
ncbi:MAG: glycosyltransferase family 4 protein [Chloroflexota bacterium]|nr:glycosyltransferase family 4 protein [Chloroflexota bacterium]